MRTLDIDGSSQFSDIRNKELKELFKELHQLGAGVDVRHRGELVDDIHISSEIDSKIAVEIEKLNKIIQAYFRALTFLDKHDMTKSDRKNVLDRLSHKPAVASLYEQNRIRFNQYMSVWIIEYIMPKLLSSNTVIRQAFEDMHFYQPDPKDPDLQLEFPMDEHVYSNSFPRPEDKERITLILTEKFKQFLNVVREEVKKMK